MLFEEYLDYEREEAAKEASHRSMVQNILDLLEDHGVPSEELLRKLEL